MPAGPLKKIRPAGRAEAVELPVGAEEEI